MLFRSVSKSNKSKFIEQFGDRFHLFYLENWLFKTDYAQETLNAHFNTTSLKGFGIDHLEEGIVASGAIMHYLSETQHNKLQHINNISRISEDAYVWMDRFTIRNLELYHGNAQQAVTLLDVIDKTITPMGSRMLKRWLSLPLKQLDKINERLEAVGFLKQNQKLLQDLQHQLKQISDLERLISKIATQKVNPRELIQLKDSLDAIIPIKEALYALDNESLKVIADNMHTCDLLREKIGSAIQENAPVLLSKGQVIAKGYNSELDELRQLAFSGKDYLDEMLERESEKTGISKLKIGSNNVFGYYLEVRHAHKDKVPEDWIRKQTLVNAERYITEELKTYEAKILSAEEKIGVLEAHLYDSIVTWCQDYIKPVQQNALLVSKLDVLSGFAQLAIEEQYNRPEITEDYTLNINQGRHPVIEKQLPEGEMYIANDVFLDREEQQIIMITGPNMSGKSALLRQTAIIVLLAQIGCFVPAEEAQIGIVDKIFTRVGASDNISMGESTFMVEMNETASILNNISKRSLVLLDEIGRGTSTYDGISIAWAITEYLHEHPSKAKTLFATHYHELNEMTHQFKRIKNYNVSIKEYKDSILFLRTLKPGGSAHSFGIHVAKMAGMPQHVIRKAEKILKKLEDAHAVEDNKEVLQNAGLDAQLSFFQLDDPLLESIKEEIVNLDIDVLTPVEALMKLNEIKRLLKPDK